MKRIQITDFYQKYNACYKVICFAIYEFIICVRGTKVFLELFSQSETALFLYLFKEIEKLIFLSAAY